MYNYFVSYSTLKFNSDLENIPKFYNTCITRNKPIVNIDDIIEIEKQLKKERDAEYVTILNFREFTKT